MHSAFRTCSWERLLWSLVFRIFLPPAAAAADHDDDVGEEASFDKEGEGEDEEEAGGKEKEGGREKRAFRFLRDAARAGAAAGRLFFAFATSLLALLTGVWYTAAVVDDATIIAANDVSMARRDRHHHHHRRRCRQSRCGRQQDRGYRVGRGRWEIWGKRDSHMA